MVKISSQVEQPTPGGVRADQVPPQRVHVPDVAPQMRNLTSLAAVQHGEALELVAEADESNGVLAKRVSLLYRIGREGEYVEVLLKKDRNDGLFRYLIEPPYLLGCDTLSYYFVAADGDKVTRTETYDVAVSAGAAGLRLNVSDGELLSGQAVVRALASNDADPEGIQLALDGAESPNTYPELAGDAYLMFELSGVHRMFCNAVVAGEDILHRLSYDDVVLEHDTVVVPLSPETLRRHDYSVEVRVGSRDRVFEDRDWVAADHFTVKDVRLVLPDGGIVQDERWSDSNETVAIGGNEGQPVSVRFHFAIPAERLRAKAAVWETTGLAEGEHRITAAAPGLEKRSTTVRIDNCGPEIRTNVEERATFRGRFRLEAEAVDTVSGVAAVRATLDGREIAVPCDVSTNELGAGVHTLQVVALDGAGNRAELCREFHVALPQQPQLLSPEEGAAAGRDELVLRAQVGDSSGDALTVTFFEGEKLTALSGNRVQVYRGEAESEPPEEAEPAGETRLADEELQRISARDDRYLTLDSVKFPYVRFEIQAGEDCGEGAAIEVEWTGRTLPGRRVTMYAWHHGLVAWEPLASRMAESEDDFTLCGVMGVAEYVRDGRVNVMVQDLIAAGSEAYDFTFILMPDSQMYSMMYPGDYEVQTNWIKDQQEAMNIRYVAHVGDVVDVTEEDFQWQNASRSMRVL
jgi:hypothetical protein